MIDIDKVINNNLENGSKYAANFDYLMHDFIIRTFKPYFNGEKLLELGAYKGVMTKKLIKHFNSVDAIELERDLVNILENDNEHRSVKIIFDDFTNFKNYGNYSDIISCHSLEHIDDHISFLKHIKKFKKENSHFYIVVPNGSSLSRKIAVKMGLIKSESEVTSFEKDIGHFHTFNREKLLKDLIDVGFEIIDSGGIMLKIFSNNQFDRSLENGIISLEFIDALYELGKTYADLCASSYFVCK